MADHNSPYTGAQIDDAARQTLANKTPFFATLLAADWEDTDVFGKRTTVSGVSVALNTATFKSALSNTPALKTFTYNSSAGSWQLAGSNVTLSTYGITLTGTPANGNMIVVEYAVLKAQTLTVTGASADYDLSADLYLLEVAVPSEMAEQLVAWGLILRYLVATDAVTFYCAAAAPAYAILHVVAFIPTGTAYGAHAAVPDMPFVIGEFALAAAPADAAFPVVLFVPAGTATGADTAIPIVQVQFAAVQAVARIGKIVSLMTLISAHQPPRRDNLDDTHHSNNKIAGKEKSHGHTYDETSPGNAPVRRDKQQPRQCKRDHA